MDHAPLFVIKEIVERNISNKSSLQELTFRLSLPVIEKIVWIAPIREKPKRTYDNLKAGFSPEGSHTPYLINDILNGENKKASTALTDALQKFGKESGLFKDIIAKRYGKGNSSPFEISVVLSKEPLKITNVGYGISQVLPIIVESFIHQKQITFAIQQPEVHLHPRAQAALGSFFYQLAKDENKNFILETHSDFLIDRFRQNINKSEKYIPSQILFFHRREAGNVCYPIKINKDGSFAEDQPDSFRDFFIKEQLALLEM